MTKNFTLREIDGTESSATTPPPLPPPPPPPPPLHRYPVQPDLYLYLGPSPSLRPLPPPLEQVQPSPPLPKFPPPQPNNPLPFYCPEPETAAAATRRPRRNPTHRPREGKPTTIEPPFPWATNHRAQVHTLKYLIDRGINTISGEVHCKRCEKEYDIEYNLQDKFLEVGTYLAENKDIMRHRAPPHWMNPILLKCNYCHQDNSVKPKMAEKKKSINWLFLLLGQMLGCCTLEQLKYFCKHTACHRTGAKNRLVFSTYLGVCNQVDPSGPFVLHT